MEQECFRAIEKEVCNKSGRYQRGVEVSGIWKGQRRWGWGHGIRRINGAG